MLSKWTHIISFFRQLLDRTRAPIAQTATYTIRLNRPTTVHFNAARRPRIFCLNIVDEGEVVATLTILPVPSSGYAQKASGIILCGEEVGKRKDEPVLAALLVPAVFTNKVLRDQVTGKAYTYTWQIDAGFAYTLKLPSLVILFQVTRLSLKKDRRGDGQLGTANLELLCMHQDNDARPDHSPRLGR